MAASALRLAVYLHDLSGGGVERMRLELIGRLREAGVDVTLLLHADRGELRALLPADLKREVFATRRTLADLPKLIRYLRRERPDVLLSSLGHNNIVALLAGAFAGGRTRVVVCQHNALSSEAAPGRHWRYRVLPWLYRLLAPFAARFVAVSEGVAADMARRCGMRRARITVIGNPVIGKDFSARADGVTEHPWLRDPRVPVLVSVGRLVRQKDHATLIAAFALLRRRMRARLLIFGHGELHDALAAQIAALDLGEDVELAGFVADPLPSIRAARALVLSSLHEGFGNVLVEALGCGTPVVSTDCPFGPAEILAGGRYGILVPPGDAGALAAALAQTLCNRPPAGLLRSRAADFTSAASAEAYLALFRDVTGAAFA